MSAVVHRDSANRWWPSPLVAASIGVHVVAIAVPCIELGLWTWALLAVVANQALLTLGVLWPRSRLLGPNLTRLSPAATARGEVALTFDDGPSPELTPKVLDLLATRGMRATFFCVAAKAARHPELMREIALRGHEVGNHSHFHSAAFACLGFRGLRLDIDTAQAILMETAGRAPRFFRPPMGFRSPLLDPVLHALGLKLVTWTRRGYDTLHGDAAKVAARLERDLAAGDILLLHDGHCARTPSGDPVVLEVLPRLLDAIQRQGLKPVRLDQAIDP